MFKFLVYEVNSVGLCCEMCINSTDIIGLYSTLERAKSEVQKRIKAGINDGFVENEDYSTDHIKTMCYKEKDNTNESFEIIIKEMMVE